MASGYFLRLNAEIQWNPHDQALLDLIVPGRLGQLEKDGKHNGQMGTSRSPNIHISLAITGEW